MEIARTHLWMAERILQKWRMPKTLGFLGELIGKLNSYLATHTRADSDDRPDAT